MIFTSYKFMFQSLNRLRAPKKTMESGLFVNYINHFSNTTEMHIKKTKTSQNYLKAVNDLNSLQCNQVLNKNEKLDGKGLLLMRQLLYRTGVTDEDMSKMNVVHITGTKGKGSTSALVEGILLQNNVKTGFFNSPHLVEVRERIRINGKPISKLLFSKYYWEVKHALEISKKKYSIQMPSYFYLLTTLAYYIFKKEAVEAAIFEVGIGGAFDSTNVIKKPAVCGIATLDLDHVTMLGDTIEKIAWQKAGIMKPGVKTYTIPQAVGGMDILIQRAKELGSNLSIALPLKKYLNSEEIRLSMAGNHQKLNGSLAVALSREWLSKCRGIKFVDSKLDHKILKGLSIGKLNGRSHIVKYNNRLTFYLDGAHTEQSIKCAANWFKDQSDKDSSLTRKNVLKLMVFNLTHNRSSYNMFKSLVKCKFDRAYFSPNIVSISQTHVADQNDFSNSYTSQLEMVKKNYCNWKEVAPECVFEKSKSFPCVNNTLDEIYMLSNDKYVQVLVIGSFHLVGAFLSIIHPDLND